MSCGRTGEGIDVLGTGAPDEWQCILSADHPGRCDYGPGAPRMRTCGIRVGWPQGPRCVLVTDHRGDCSPVLLTEVQP